MREAVLRMKDPIVLLQEIEEIEKSEGEMAGGEPLPNEKGLLEKKRKLHGNLDRIVKYWVSKDRVVTCMWNEKDVEVRNISATAKGRPEESTRCQTVSCSVALVTSHTHYVYVSAGRLILDSEKKRRETTRLYGE